MTPPKYPSAQGSKTPILVLFFVLIAGFAAHAEARDLYVSPVGLPANDGSIAHPLDLATALSGLKTHPGDTVWLRDGRYVGTFTSNLAGTPDAPVVLRQFPGERATLDARSATEDTLVVSRSSTYATYWGFEVTNSYPTRTTGAALTVYGAHTKFINLIIHDGGKQGIGFWTEAVDSELYGSIVSNNGFDQPGDRGYGHSVYTQNAEGTKVIADNIMFNSFSFGIHAYTQAGAVDNFHIEGNILFNHGLASALSGAKSNMIFGGGQSSHRLTIIDNYSYYRAETGGRAADIGYVAPCDNASVHGNYFAATIAVDLNCTAMTFTSNRLVGRVVSLGRPLDPANPLDSSNIVATSLPAATEIFVRPNKYEPGRANIVVYNWRHEPVVSVAIANLLGPDGQPLLSDGDPYEIRDAENFFGKPVAEGIYRSGASLSLRMTGLVAAPPVGVSRETPHTGPEFGAFVLLPRRGVASK